MTVWKRRIDFHVKFILFFIGNIFVSWWSVPEESHLQDLSCSYSSLFIISYPVLYCIAPFCTVMSCTVLSCIVLSCTVMCCPILYCTVLYYVVLYCTVLCCPVLSCLILLLHLDMLAFIIFLIYLLAYSCPSFHHRHHNIGELCVDWPEFNYEV